VSPLKVTYHLLQLNEFGGQIVKFLKVSNSVYIVTDENNKKKVYTSSGKEVADIILPKSKYCRNTLSRRTLDINNLRCVCGDKAYSWFHYKGLRRYVIEHDLKSGKTSYVMPIFGSTMILNIEILCLTINGIDAALLIPYPFDESYAVLGLEPSIIWNEKLVPVKGLGSLVTNFEGATSSYDMAAFWTRDKLTVVRLGCSDSGFTVTNRWNFTFDDDILDVAFWGKDMILTLIPGELYVVSLESRRVIVKGSLKPDDAKVIEVSGRDLYLASSKRLYYLEALPAEATLKKQLIANLQVV